MTIPEDFEEGTPVETLADAELETLEDSSMIEFDGSLVTVLVELKTVIGNVDRDELELPVPITAVFDESKSDLELSSVESPEETIDQPFDPVLE